MSVKKFCILEYVERKTKATLQVFLSGSEAWIACRLLSKVKNELKKNIIYSCVFGIDISTTHVYLLMEELNFEFKKLEFKG